MRLIFFTALMCPMVAFAQTPLPESSATPPAGIDLKTRDGRVYKQARVFRVEPDGINYIFAGGMVKIPFNELPSDVQKANGYDPKAAAEYAAADAAVQARAAQSIEASQAEAARKAQALAVETASHIDAMPARSRVGSLNVLNIGRVETAGSLEAAGTQTAGKTVTLEGDVLSVDKENQVLIVSCAGRKRMIGAESVEGIAGLTGVPVLEKITDGCRIRVTAREAGSYSYGSASGAAMTVGQYVYSSGVFYKPSGVLIK